MFYNEKTANKINCLMEDQDVVSEICSAQDTNQLKQVFESHEVFLCDEDLAEIHSKVKDIDADGELPEECLENVSGGCILCAAAMIGSAIVVGYIVFRCGKWIIDRRYGGKK